MPSENLNTKNEDENGGAPEMPRLRIPEEYRRGFAQLIALAEEPFSELLAVLEQESPALYPSEFSEKLAVKIRAIPSEDIDAIVDTLISLYEIRPTVDAEIPDFAELLVEAVERNEDAELKLLDEGRDRFKNRLVRLLDLKALDATSKALEVLLEHEHTLHGARIMTDIRPIFGSNVEESPEAMVIVHMLKISYHDESEEVKEFYVALDTGDVGSLIKTLERANTKAESLKRVLKKTQVPYIDAG